MSSIPNRVGCYSDIMDFLPWTHLHSNSDTPGRKITPSREILGEHHVLLQIFD
jgi:hypothetical protein